MCEQLFKGITENQDKEGSSFEVKFSMLEIYNEVAIDLLDAKNSGKKKQSGLKIENVVYLCFVNCMRRNY